MDDVISREAVKKELEELIRARRNWLSDGSGEIRGIEVAYCAIDGFPTVDAVEVVRCKECVENDAQNWCWKFGYTMHDGDFCSFGERKTDG